jgi:hypothetical protein
MDAHEAVPRSLDSTKAHIALDKAATHRGVENLRQLLV